MPGQPVMIKTNGQAEETLDEVRTLTRFFAGWTLERLSRESQAATCVFSKNRECSPVGLAGVGFFGIPAFRYWPVLQHLVRLSAMPVFV